MKHIVGEKEGGTSRQGNETRGCESSSLNTMCNLRDVTFSRRRRVI